MLVSVKLSLTLLFFQFHSSLPVQYSAMPPVHEVSSRASLSATSVEQSSQKTPTCPVIAAQCMQRCQVCLSATSAQGHLIAVTTCTCTSKMFMVEAVQWHQSEAHFSCRPVNMGACCFWCSSSCGLAHVMIRQIYKVVKKCFYLMFMLLIKISTNVSSTLLRAFYWW